ncbi:MAG TPA: NAD(P)H-dependent oxidoreductase subunit E [Bacteroidales bacterium]|nr:NAD(P)H-dependent oxidoreductase subunit E [Bacteroidales bacterium]HOK74531.1 NAD(P)H-dependent oxidoreductase subunit E [Bacteroidales bacterium]HOM41175.1 NAD(P)H-dependent oxidoreductase subunit E [Bacteroidales bacterium]HOU31465.1 NAD(P)H-dependent oxidoreductase subunit E [Bacteroidales bacterium]HPP93320.1 NAD(P)H-dependent oxidoreductase subunit E [Bacteroidales bacterium]
MPESRFEIQICLGSSCFSRGNKNLVKIIQEYLKKNHIDDKVVFKGSRCMGYCSEGPNLVINGKIIKGINAAEAEAILDRELQNIK